MNTNRDDKNKTGNGYRHDRLAHNNNNRLDHYGRSASNVGVGHPRTG